MFLDVFGEEGLVGTKRFLGDLHVAVVQFCEEAQRLRAVLELQAVLTEPLRPGEPRQLLVHERQRGLEVLAVGALLLLDELAGVGVRDRGRKCRRGRGGRDVDDARFSLPRDAQAAADLFLRQSLAELAGGLCRHVAELHEFEVAGLLGQQVAGIGGRQSSDLLAERVDC